MEQQNIEDELVSIRSMMERSSKFISLSGLSGIMAGVYALAAAAYAHSVLYHTGQVFERHEYRDDVILPLFVLAVIVLALSIGTGLWLSFRKAKRKGLALWSPSSKALVINGGIPLITGGLFVLIMLNHQQFVIISAACLIFYGLALVAASQHTFGDVKWLGIFEILLGLAALFRPGYGLYIWALGFGVLHIIYGSLMYFKYDR